MEGINLPHGRLKTLAALLLAYDIGDIPVAVAVVGLTVIVKLLAPLSST